MAVIVRQSTFLQIDNAADCISYLQAVYAQASSPYPPAQQLRIVNRFLLPNDVSAYNVGVLVYGRDYSPIVNLWSLTTDGLFTVVAVAKVNVAPYP